MQGKIINSEKGHDLAWARPLRWTLSQGTQARPGRERIGSPRHKARVSQAGRFQGARCILGLVSTVTHVHSTQPRPSAAGTTSPRIPRACLSLHTGSPSQTLKETPKAPSRCSGPRSLLARAVLCLRNGPPYRVAGPDASASTPDGQKLDNCVTHCQTYGPPGTPTPSYANPPPTHTHIHTTPSRPDQAVSSQTAVLPRLPVPKP